MNIILSLMISLMLGDSQNSDGSASSALFFFNFFCFLNHFFPFDLQIILGGIRISQATHILGKYSKKMSNQISSSQTKRHRAALTLKTTFTS